MSNIYIQEPPTSGKVLLKTSAGDIDIELWSRECPKACRNFIQLCMEGYYNGTIFHRVVKNFIVQGGDPNGDGSGGESIYGHPFKDEFHSRLRFARRGLVAMANSDKDDNGSQFFFTMAATPELQNKHTLFGKVTGDTIFNMLKLEEGMVDQNERPMYPQKILRTEILSNPFDDIQPRLQEKKKKSSKKDKREKGVKNFGLLSFGEEAEEDEVETNHFVEKNAGKAKSMHDIVDDPKLSKMAIKIETVDGSAHEEELDEDRSVVIKEEAEDAAERMQRIKDKLKANSKQSSSVVKVELQSDSDEDVLVTHEQEKKKRKDEEKEKIRNEIANLKKQYQTDKRVKNELLEKKEKPENDDTKLYKNAEDNELIQSFIQEKQKYSSSTAKIPKKGSGREELTLNLLAQFRAKLEKLKHNQTEDAAAADDAVDDSVVEQEIKGDDWLAHTLKFEDKAPVLAKDASTKGDDWYDAYDPRNPLNKRKRGENTNSNKKLTK